MIEWHIHLDQYRENELEKSIRFLSLIQFTSIRSVSSCLNARKPNLASAKKYTQVQTGFGFHSEHTLPRDA